MSELALVNPPADDAPAPTSDKSIRDLYALVEANLERVGGLEPAAGVMKMDRGDLRRALDGKGRYLAIDHVIRFGERVREYSTEATQRIAAAIVGPMDLLVFPRKQLTAAERARRYEKLLLSMPLGAELVRHALETP